jgi:TRAP-type C4-dicarboxylate transport system substrate-binding protein
MGKFSRLSVLMTGVAAAAAIAGSAMAADMTLRASHQWPAGKGDVRDEMVQMIKTEVEAANVGLTIQVHPGASLFKPNQQWEAMVKGQLDLSAFPLDYASGKHPQFSATLMPGLVKNHEHAKRLNDSPFMDDIKKIINDAGVVVISDAWLAGGFASAKKCILEPDDAKGQTLRAAGPAFEQMLAAAGASINAMPSSEIYTGLQTGVLDGTNTSSGSFVSYRIYEQVKCLTEPGESALWFMYEPILMSKQSWDKLDDAQKSAITAAGEKAEDFFFGAAKGLDTELVDVYKKNGVEVVSMSPEQQAKWVAIAKGSSYKIFADEVPGGKELIKKALAVQ